MKILEAMDITFDLKSYKDYSCLLKISSLKIQHWRQSHILEPPSVRWQTDVLFYEQSCVPNLMSISYWTTHKVGKEKHKLGLLKEHLQFLVLRVFVFEMV